MENRTRFATRVIRGIKDRVGIDYPVGARINGQEFRAKGSITTDESVEIASILEKAGLDYISVSGCGYGEIPFKFVPDLWLYPEPTEDMKPYVKVYKEKGLFLPAAEKIKGVVSIPVIGVGNITPERGEKFLKEERIDLVAFGRPLFADPELPDKICSGQVAEIRHCTHCATCVSYKNFHRQCRVNPAMGREGEFAEYNWKRPAAQKKIMVVGGGPSGMEAAWIAAKRGHKVSLYEKGAKLGGILPLASMIKGVEIEDLPSLVQYLKLQMAKAKVDIHLNTEVSPALVDRVNPDAIILAVGGRPTSIETMDLPGIDSKKVVTTSELHRRVKKFLNLFGPKLLRWLTKFYLPVGKKVIVVGGALEGCEAAEFLVKRNRTVTVIEESNSIGTGIPEGYIERVEPYFKRKGVTVLTGVKYEKVTDRGLVISRDGEQQTLEADTIMMVQPCTPNTDLLNSLKNKVPEIHMIASANGADSRLIMDAMIDGRNIGCTI